VVTFRTINSNVVENKVTGLVVDSVPEARAALRELLDNREFALHLGRNARMRIKERFSPVNFRNRWNTLFYRAAYEHAKNSCSHCLPG
jgi:glycosyltransferase involved in cell wall biosynthesis